MIFFYFMFLYDFNTAPINHNSFIIRPFESVF